VSMLVSANVHTTHTGYFCYLTFWYWIWYGDDVCNVVERTLVSSPYNPNALVAISKGMKAVKLCFNKILQFLTGGAG